MYLLILEFVLTNYIRCIKIFFIIILIPKALDSNIFIGFFFLPAYKTYFARAIIGLLFIIIHSTQTPGDWSPIYNTITLDAI